jgi:hypothetical protein
MAHAMAYANDARRGGSSTRSLSVGGYEFSGAVGRLNQHDHDNTTELGAHHDATMRNVIRCAVAFITIHEDCVRTGQG